MLERLHAHREWANKRIFEWVSSSAQEDEYCVKVLSHILLAEQNILRRLHGEAPGDGWQRLTAEESSLLAGANDAAWREELKTDLSRTLHYRLLDGTDTQSVAADLAVHACTHGVYHRGQIAAQAARLGLHCPPTDFIVYSRLVPG